MPREPGPRRVIEHFVTIRVVHVAAALASGLLFLLRGVAMWRGSAWAGSARVRWLSYAIDTLLLVAAVVLATMLRLVPLVDARLTTKIGLVALYIVLGSLALKRAPTMRARRICLVGALLVFAAILVVARDHGAVHWALAAIR